MATWNGSKYRQVWLAALWSDCSAVGPTTTGWWDSQPACREPGRPRMWVMPTCSKMQHFDIQSEASLSWLPDQPGVRSGDAVWVFTCFKRRGVCEWGLLRESKVKDGRTEMMPRWVRGWQRAGQRLNRCRCRDLNVARWRVSLASPFCQTHRVNTKSPRHAAVCKNSSIVLTNLSCSYDKVRSSFWFHVQMLIQKEEKHFSYDLFSNAL